MITPKDLANLSVIEDVVVLASADAVRRRAVKEIAVMDAEPLTGDYDSFYPGDAVFTSLGFSGGDSALIDEALGCGEAAKRMGHSAVSWDMLGPDAFRVARQNGWLLERACAASLDRLAASDAEAGSNLVESLRVYVACGGDANAAAERLCQHPNSVRNRVNRARAVLAMEDATDKQLFAYLSMIFL